MAKYIDAEKIKYYEHTVCCGHGDYRPVRTVSDEDIEALPAADVVEVRHGEWEVRGQDVCCSVCGGESAYNPFGASKFSIYCPNCGAKMDGKGEADG